MKFIKATIILFIFLASLGLFNVADAATEVVRTIKPSGQGGDYTTLAAWEAGEQRNLVTADEVAVAQIDGNWSTPDTTAVTIDGWTTDATHYIKIYTTPQSRHGGKPTGHNYLINPNTSDGGIDIGESHTAIDGLEITGYGGNGWTSSGIYLSSSYNIISNNLIHDEVSGNDAPAISAGGGTYGGHKIYNNVIYKAYYGINVDHWSGITSYLYNNTVANCFFRGINHGNGEVVIKNNISYNNTTDYVGAFNALSASNLSKDATAPAFGTYYRNATVNFASESNDDFHLNSTDTGAKNFGADLTNDASLPFNTDIDGYVRNQVWDIGADEVGGNTRVIFSPDPGQETNFGAATAIYRSVGPGNTTALAVGTSNTLTITGSTATFSSPLPDRIGVGDALQYDDDNDSDIDVNDSIVFIHSRTDSKTFTVKTASGGSPTSIASDNNWSIFRAYTSLSLAEAGTENTGIDADLRAFDTFSGGKDIATSNEVWNIAAYGDAPDTTAVTIDGWTTDADNFIRIYTPVSKEEVGASQRHRGKWDDGKYNLLISTEDHALRIQDPNVHIDGLQIQTTSGAYDDAYGIYLYSSGVVNVKISNNIIRDGNNSRSGRCGILINPSISVPIYVWNNIIYDFSGTGGTGITSDGDFGTPYNYVYNNTIVNCAMGIDSSYEKTKVVNNIVQNCSNGFDASDTFISGDFNISDVNGDTAGISSSYRDGLVTSVTFADIVNKDFHLNSTDTGAKNAGANLTNDINLPFSIDIDGQNRVGSWDIGADERPASTVIKGGVRITK